MTTAPLAGRLQVRSAPVAWPGDLLDLLPSDSGVLSWVRDGDGLVGWGEVASVRVSGPTRFADAARWWATVAGSLDIDDEVGLPGSGAVAFVSMAFGDTPGDSVLVVPRVVIGRHAGCTWITEIAAPGFPEPVAPVRAPRRLRYADGQLPVPAWRDAVGAAVRRMRAGALDKVVLAHDLMAHAAEPIDARFVLLGLARQYPSCWTFAVDGLVGATPELLLCRNGTQISSRVLAGTSWADQHGGRSDRGAALLSSVKNRGEHQYAVESLASTLRPFCAELAVPSTPSVLQLRNVAHLASEVHGRLDTPPGSLLEIAAAVHPTAAVGGTPTVDAIRTIADLEPMDRGRYAGPVGWVDADGNGELGLALRCAQLSGNSARLFAGCGIVADSDPDTEVVEAAAKLVPVRDALERR